MGKDITPEMTFDEVLAAYPESAQVFERYGLHCHKCAIARLETLADGAMLHDLDLAQLLRELRALAPEGGGGPE